MLKQTSESLERVSGTLKDGYTDFKLISQTSYYKVYQAKSQATKEIHTIRILDPSCGLVDKDFNLTATLFFQEILHFCKLPGASEAVLPELFEFHGDKIYFVSKQPYYPLSYELTNFKKVTHDIPKFLKDITLQMKWFSKENRFNIPEVNLQNIFHLVDTDTFFVADWAKNLNPNAMSESVLNLSGNFSKDKVNKDTSAKIYSLGCVALYLSGQEQQDIEDLIKISNLKHYNAALNDHLKMVEIDAEIKTLLKNILCKDPTERVTLDILILGLGIETMKIERSEAQDNSKKPIILQGVETEEEDKDFREKVALSQFSEGMRSSKYVPFKVTFPSQSRQYHFELYSDDSFEEVVKFAEEQLGFAEDKLTFMIGEVINLKYRRYNGSYFTAGEVYLAGQSIGWRGGDVAEITINTIHF